MDYLTTAQFEAYVTGCADRANVRVEWDRPDAVPRTDGNTIWLPTPTQDTDQKVIDALRYFIKHETSHIVYTDFEWWKTKRATMLLGLIMNMLEDNRIDYLNDKEYLGDREIQVNYLDIFFPRLQGFTSKVLDQQTEALLLLFAWDSINRPLHPTYATVRDHILSIGNPFVNAKYPIIVKFNERLAQLRKPGGGREPLYQLAVDICKDVFDMTDDDIKKMTQPEQPKKGKGEPGDEEEEGSVPRPGEGDPEDGDGSDAEGAIGEEAGDGEGKPAPGDDVDRLISMKWDDVAKFVGEHLTPTRTGKHLVLPEEFDKWATWKMPTKEDYEIRRFKRGDEAGISTYSFRIREVNNALDELAKPLATRLRHHLQIISKGRWEYGTKQGRLHSGSLHRLVSARGTEQEKRIFRKQHTTDTLDTAVSLLVDCSGSMSGTKYEMACTGAAALSLALKPLHIAHTVLGFTNNVGASNDNNVINVFQEWNESISQQELVRRFAIASQRLMDNADCDAIAWASRDLLTRREKRRILIVLSDGSPAGRRSAGNPHTQTKRVVGDIEKHGMHEIYGIGIMDENVSRFYTHYVVISNVSALPDSILSIIKRSVK